MEAQKKEMKRKIKQSERTEQAWDVASQTDPGEEWIMVFLTVGRGIRTNNLGKQTTQAEMCSFLFYNLKCNETPN